MKQFKIKDFLLDFTNNWSKLNMKPPDKSNINQDVINLAAMFSSVRDKHAPMRPMYT